MGRDRTLDLIRNVRAGVLYFAIVFAAGFVLGTLRVLFVVPAFGVRIAELAEMPFMLAAAFFAARWLVGKLDIAHTMAARATMGATGLALLLLAEFGLVVWLQHLTLGQYFQTRDPVSGTAYFFSLALFAVFPFLVHRGSAV